MKQVQLIFLFLSFIVMGRAQNVGIGTSKPEAKLDVVGTIKITDGTQAAGKVLTSDATGLASWQTIPSSASDYPIVGMGCQSWMTKNLDVTTYSDGTPLPHVTDPIAWANLTTGAWVEYSNITANGIVYGLLYNYYAVAGIYDAASATDPSLRKKLAPAGWHIPTDLEWTILVNTLGGNVQGGDLKEIGFSHWTTPNTSATNISGFNGVPGGYRNSEGAFSSVRNAGYMWSITENNADFAWCRLLSYNSGTIGKSSLVKRGGFSVRCLRD